MKKRENRTEQVRVNVTPDELKEIKEAAERNNMSTSAFCSNAIRKFNKKQIQVSNCYLESVSNIVSQANLAEITGDYKPLVQEVIKVWQFLQKQ